MSPNNYQKKISVIKSNFANLHSITNSLDFLGFKYLLTDQEKDILDSDILIFPGVGSFQAVKKDLDQKNLTTTIKNFLNLRQKLFLGICLGMQLLFEESEEGGQTTQGLEIFKGKVIALDPGKAEFVPHIGWNSLYSGSKKQESQRTDFYFVHSLFCDAKKKEEIIAYTEPGKNYRIPAFVKKQTKRNTSIYGVQFHPEKSGKNGLKFIKDFLEL